MPLVGSLLFPDDFFARQSRTTHTQLSIRLTRARKPLNARLPQVGRLAQLVEHLVYTERVGSSSLSSPTTQSILLNIQNLEVN